MTRLSNTEMRRLAHRLAAGIVDDALKVGAEFEGYLPGQPDPDSPEAIRLCKAVQAIVDKLYNVGDRE